MQQELGTDEIVILGVNQLGRESGNALICAGRDLPWLQETVDQQVWTPWEIRYRDIAVVNRQGELVGTFNVTDNPISSDPTNVERRANYDALKQMLQDAR
ncbi:MAG: hypothetical protein AAF533_11855 [Acidobacteriota bacterium]